MIISPSAHKLPRYKGYYILEKLPVIRISSDKACVDNIFPFGGCDIAEFTNSARILLHRFCKFKVLLTLAA